jgi:hypothetical protein
MLTAGGLISAAVNNASWGNSTVSVTALNVLTFQLVAIPTFVPSLSAPPTVGELTIEAVHGSVFITAPTAGVICRGCVCLYVGKENQIGGSWDTRQPSSPSDAARDDYLFLQPFTFATPTSAAATGAVYYEVKLSIQRRITIGGGEALHLGVDNIDPTNALPATVWARTRISRVT